MVSNEGVGDADRDGLRGANHSNSLAIARICKDADRPKPRPHTHEEIVNTFLAAASQCHPRHNQTAARPGAPVQRLSPYQPGQHGHQHKGQAHHGVGQA